jgi:hypothetical protein
MIAVVEGEPFFAVLLCFIFLVGLVLFAIAFGIKTGVIKFPQPRNKEKPLQTRFVVFRLYQGSLCHADFPNFDDRKSAENAIKNEGNGETTYIVLEVYFA